MTWVQRLDVQMLLVFLVLAAGMGTCLAIASEVMEGDTLAIDQWVLLHLRTASDPGVPIGPGWLRESMVDLTALGGGTVLSLVTLLAAGYLVARRKTSLAILLAVAITAGGLLNKLLKYGFVRERPDVVPHLVEVTSASFPSGHAMNSAMVYLTLGALLTVSEKSWRVRIYLMSVAILLTLIVGSSRMYLGVHWPTDVLAGWTVGAAWAVVCYILVRMLQRRHALGAAEVAKSDDLIAGLPVEGNDYYAYQKISGEPD